MSERAEFNMIVDVPNELAAAWLQHVRAFDLQYPGCHFMISGEIDAPTGEVVQLFEKLNFSEIRMMVRGNNETEEKGDGREDGS